MKKILLFIAAALIFTGCEKEEYWEHQTPENPVIAHLMCVEIDKIPYDGYYYTCAVQSKRADWSETIFKQKDLPIKLQVDGGQRVDKDIFAMSIYCRSSQDSEYIVLINATEIPSLTALKELGCPKTVSFTSANNELVGKWYFRYD